MKLNSHFFKATILSLLFSQKMGHKTCRAAKRIETKHMLRLKKICRYRNKELL